MLRGGILRGGSRHLNSSLERHLVAVERVDYKTLAVEYSRATEAGRKRG